MFTKGVLETFYVKIVISQRALYALRYEFLQKPMQTRVLEANGQ